MSGTTKGICLDVETVQFVGTRSSGFRASLGRFAEILFGRLAPRHVFDASIGTDNLFHRGEHTRVTARFTVMNFANRDALYNFQSTFSGTHFLAPRTYTGSLGFVF
jgi:hypothetical protein